MPPPDEEAGTPLPSFEESVGEAVGHRPEPRQFETAARAQRDLVRSAGGSFFPALSFNLSPTFVGADMTALTPNLQLVLSLSYPVAGPNPLLTDGQMRESRAAAHQLSEQARSARNSIRLELGGPGQPHLLAGSVDSPPAAW